MLVIFWLKNLQSKCHTCRAYPSRSLEPHFRVSLHEDNTLFHEVNKTLKNLGPSVWLLKLIFQAKLDSAQKCRPLGRSLPSDSHYTLWTHGLTNPLCPWAQTSLMDLVIATFLGLLIHPLTILQHSITGKCKLIESPHYYSVKSSDFLQNFSPLLALSHPS